jgi:hypothetical protein
MKNLARHHQAKLLVSQLPQLPELNLLAQTGMSTHKMSG